MTAAIKTATTTDQMAHLLSAYCLGHNLPYESADLLLLEVLGRIEDLHTHAQWLQEFIDRWDEVQAEEDTKWRDQK